MKNRPELRQSELAREAAEHQTTGARSGSAPSIRRARSVRSRPAGVRKQRRRELAHFRLDAMEPLRRDTTALALPRPRLGRIRRAGSATEAAQRVRLEVFGHGPTCERPRSGRSGAAAVAQAEESLRITKNRYDSGLTTVTDLLRNETALLEARTRRLAAIHDQRARRATRTRSRHIVRRLGGPEMIRLTACSASLMMLTIIGCGGNHEARKADAAAGRLFRSL